MRVPKLMKLVLGYSCQHSCLYCYNESDPQKVKSTPSTIDAIISECGKYGITDMSFTGGEPLLHRDFLYTGLESAYKWNMYSTVNTNLVLLKQEDIDIFQKTNIVSLFASMPGASEAEYNHMTSSQNFNKFTKALELCKEFDMHIAINMVTTKENYKKVYSTGKWLHEHFGVINFGASPIYPSRDDHLIQMLSAKEVESIYDDLLQLENDFGMNVTTFRSLVPCFSLTPEKYIQFTRGCGAVRTELSVLSDGTIKACDSIPKTYSNILEKPLPNIIEEMDSFLPFEESTLYKIMPDECKSCAEALNCRGGCRIEAQLFNKNLSSKNPYFTKPLESKIFPPYIELPDLSMGTLSLNYELNNLGKIISKNSLPFSKEELALLKLLAMEDNISKIDSNIFRVKYRLKDDLFKAFLNKIQKGGMINHEE